MDESVAEASTRCGFVALAGAPNAGKSTLLNALVGSKVSIVSPKVQTTRNRVLGIALDGAAQLVLVDTPGIFAAPKRRLERAMVASAWSSVGDADLVVLLIDAAGAAKSGIDATTLGIIERLPRDQGRPVLLALNKIDAVRRHDLLAVAAAANELYPFVDTFMISALTGDGVEDLKHRLSALTPEGPWAYPEDQLADMPLRLMAAEFTREQLFLKLHDELPYSVVVDTETWTEFDNGSVRIDQVVTVLRESQKAIVLGKGGQQIRRIGEAARAEIAAFLERPVHLFLLVKVRDDWIEDRERYKDLGLEFDS